MRVGVHSVGYAGVTQYLLNNLGVLPLFKHEGGEGVPEVVRPSGFRQAISNATKFLASTFSLFCSKAW